MLVTSFSTDFDIMNSVSTSINNIFFLKASTTLNKIISKSLNNNFLNRHMLNGNVFRIPFLNKTAWMFRDKTLHQVSMFFRTKPKKLTQ